MSIGLASTVCAANRPTIILTTSHYYDMAATEPPKHSATHDSDGIRGMLLLPLLLAPHRHSAPRPARLHLEHNVRGYPPSVQLTNTSRADPFHIDR